jgi:hypothetical protein
MKIYLLAIILFFLSCQSDVKNEYLENRINKKLLDNINYLDSLVNDIEKYEKEKFLNKFSDAIIFMERSTNIYSNRDGNYFGIHYRNYDDFKKDVIRWKSKIEKDKNEQ